MNPVLEMKRVSSAYVSGGGIFGRKKIRKVLDDVTIEIAPGEIFGLVGESGCGKTTLGRAILGLTDFSGGIIINGTAQESRGNARRRLAMARNVQAVFQDPAASLNPAKRALWLLEEPLRIHGEGTPAERRKRAEEMLDLAGLAGYGSRRMHEMSVGQKQRLCIGAALMLRPRLLVADEPVSSLDVSVGAQVLNLFRDLHERLGLAILFISHNLDLVYWLCGRIAVMEKGRIVEQGSAERIYAAPEHPCTQRLLAAARLENPAPCA